MFENNIFEEWLDDKAKELIKKIGNQEKLSSEEMIILVLKAQSNHFHHLDQELRIEMRDLKEDMKELRVDMDKRFEQVDKRFDEMLKRLDRFMFWSLGLVMASTLFIIKFLG